MSRFPLPLVLSALLALGLLLPAGAGTRGSDQLFWVPTVEQSLQMAAFTKRPIFLMTYTCVGKESETYSGGATVW